MKNAIKLVLKKIVPEWGIKFYRYLRSIKYLGNKVLCPCCGKTFRIFMDSGYDDGARFKGHYKNTVCPNCFSLPRHRIVCYYFEYNQHVLPESHNGILMFAAEGCIKKWFQNHEYHYTTTNLFDKNANIIVDIQNTPFLNETWSTITCNHILEHVSDYQKALKELHRILKYDGVLEIMVPTDRNRETVYEDESIVTEVERKKYFGQEDHLRIFGNNFRTILEDVGFSVEVVEGENLPENIGAKIGPSLLDDNRMYICRKDNCSRKNGV